MHYVCFILLYIINIGCTSIPCPFQEYEKVSFTFIINIYNLLCNIYIYIYSHIITIW